MLETQKALEEFKLYRSVEEAIAEPENVVRLDVRHNNDPAAVARIAEFCNLKSLDISVSDVTELLPHIGALEKLQHLSLAACNIATFPYAVLGLSDLRSLDLTNGSLTSIPNAISELANLDWLYLSMNDLQQVPATLSELSGLKRLNLMHNRMQRIGHWIGKLTLLESLILCANQLVEIPSEVGDLKSLTYLSLEYNRLETLPESVCCLRALESLNLRSNPFTSLPRCLSEMGATKITIEANKRTLFVDWTYQPSQKRPKVDLADLHQFIAPTSELHETQLAAVQKAGLSEISPLIMAVARDAIGIESTHPDDYSSLGGSRLGGFPDLPKRSLYPKTDGLYWSFLAQLNLKELAHLNQFLPRQGLLSFFVDSTEALNGTVLYHSGNFEKLSTIRHGGPEEMFSPEDDYTQKPHRVRFQRFASFPHRPPVGSNTAQYVEGYEKCLDSGNRFDHHINGHTFTQHESPQEQAADKFGGQSTEWVPLLQLGWDDKVGFCFWDAGTLTFSIHQEDLRRWDFSKVHVHLESS